MAQTHCFSKLLLINNQWTDQLMISSPDAKTINMKVEEIPVDLYTHSPEESSNWPKQKPLCGWTTGEQRLQSWPAAVWHSCGAQPQTPSPAASSGSSLSLCESPSVPAALLFFLNWFQTRGRLHIHPIKPSVRTRGHTDWWVFVSQHKHFCHFNKQSESLPD